MNISERPDIPMTTPSEPNAAPKLLPCPFCGGPARVETKPFMTKTDHSDAVDWFFIGCSGALIGTDPTCDIQPRTNGFTSLSAASESWNRRAQPAACPACSGTGIVGNTDGLSAGTPCPECQPAAEPTAAKEAKTFTGYAAAAEILRISTPTREESEPCAHQTVSLSEDKNPSVVSEPSNSATSQRQSNAAQGQFDPALVAAASSDPMGAAAMDNRFSILDLIMRDAPSPISAPETGGPEQPEWFNRIAEAGDKAEGTPSIYPRCEKHNRDEEFFGYSGVDLNTGMAGEDWRCPTCEIQRLMDELDAARERIAYLERQWLSDEPGRPGRMALALAQMVMEITKCGGSSRPLTMELEEFVAQLRADLARVTALHSEEKAIVDYLREHWPQYVSIAWKAVYDSQPPAEAGGK